MTREELDLFLLCSAGLCLLMAIVNVFRAKSRGISGYLLSGAFLAVAGAVMLYRAGSDNSAVGVVGGIAFILLVADFMVRARDQVIRGPKE
jgi:hypothetical protein